MDELTIIAAALREHAPAGRSCTCHREPICCCGRIPARGHEEHQAEEIQLALHDAGMGVFMFERLGLLEDEIP